MNSLALPKELIDKLNTITINCDNCGKCMENCSILKKSPLEYVNEICLKKAISPELPYSCTMCGLCKSVCPKQIDISEGFKEIRKEFVKKITKTSLTKGYKIIKNHQKNSFSRIFTANFTDDTNHDKRIFVPGCSLASYSSELVMKTYEYLSLKLPNTGIMLKCCGNPTELVGDAIGFNRYYEMFINTIKEMGGTEIITACPSCYKTITKNSPEIKVTSLWETLVDIGIPNNTKLKALNLTYALHDPCPTRNYSNIHQATRDIIRELGVEIEEFEFTKENTLCCGAGGMVGVMNKSLALEQMEKRADQVKSDLIITYCASCVDALRIGGKSSMHLLELIFNPAHKSNRKVSGTLPKWLNRYKCANSIMKLTLKTGGTHV